MNVRERQSERRERTRNALLESAARGISRHGYGNLVLADVARDAGYTRGALYHLFKGKQDLVLAAAEWVIETWEEEVGILVDQESDPVAALTTLARGHAVFCRRDIARMAIVLRLEFDGQDHPIGRFIERSYAELTTLCAGLIERGRAAGAIPAGAPADVLALAYVGALEGVVVALVGKAPHDEELAVGVTAGVLGLPVQAMNRPAESGRTVEERQP